MERPRVSASVRTVVEFSLLSGDLMPSGGQVSRMNEGTRAHQARQRAMAEDTRAEVAVRGQVEGETAVLLVSGRIDLLAYRGDVPVIEEIKLTPYGGPPAECVPVHRAQAVCYGHMLGMPSAVIRVVYVTREGIETAAFEETLSAEALEAAFLAFTAPYLAMVEARLAWRKVRDASVHALVFPYPAYRDGQRRMAAHAYHAIKAKKRLFAQAPTGTGKTAASLFPALKALGEGLTGQIFYLTARTTAQQNAAAALQRMRAEGLRLRALVLSAKEKICPHARAAREAGQGFRCDVIACPHAIGFYDRLPMALAAMRRQDDWAREAVEAVAQAHEICPFEFSLSLAEEADAILCDYNYAFDPGARIRRIFQWTNNLTLLVDEAHNLPDRARSMLSATLDSRMLRDVRKGAGKAGGRRAPLYLALTELIRWLEALEPGVHPERPEGLMPLLESCMDQAVAAAPHIPLGDLPLTLIGAVSALERFDAHYTVLTNAQGKRTGMTLYCLDPAPHLMDCTKKLHGTIFFSATLTPLHAFRSAIGGTEEDGLLSLPSPFPEENLLVLRCPISTRYRAREETAGAVAEAVLAMALARPGNYLCCFPSYAYVRRVKEEIEASGTDITLHVQEGGMDEAAREAYLSAFVPRDTGSLLGMVVLGGIFGEGVDLPGERLSGVAVVGVGLPQVCAEREMLRDYYEQARGEGFAQAYRYPGMNKVLQAVGRVIRTEEDLGVALLIDDRFLTRGYTELMPPWWGKAKVARGAEAVRREIEAFWGRMGATL